MSSIRLPIIGAVITALLSTLCCLPAFLFIFFGISSGILSYFTTLEFVRIPLAIISFILFIIATKKIGKNISCECSKKKKISQYIKIVSIFVFILALLIYPEILPLFME